MSKVGRRIAAYISIVFFVGVPILIALKLLLGFHIPLMNPNDKTFTYVLVAAWNVNFGYLLFKKP